MSDEIRDEPAAEDTEGHRVKGYSYVEEAGETEGHRAVRANVEEAGEDDTEGHRYIAW